MEREIRYCTTSDGARVAYCVAGEGPAHVMMTDPLTSHVQLEWSHPIIGPFLQLLSEHNTLVRFDPRGTGLSDRVLPSTPLEWVRDLEAVVTRLGLDGFALTGMQATCRAAIAFAVGHPGQVRRLALIDGFARGRDLAATPPAQALAAAAASDWEMATEAIAAAVFGPGRVEGVTHGAYIRACADRDFFMQSTPTKLGMTTLMGKLAVPTLVLRHKASKLYTGEMARELAASIRDARLVEVDGLWADDVEGFAARIVSFVSDPERTQAAGVLRSHQEPAIAPPTEAPHATAVILFADIVDSTALTEKTGDAAFRTRARQLDTALRAIIAEAGGTAIDGKLLGDGVLATFPAAAQAIDAALRCGATGDAQGLPLHLGLHAGDVIREQNTVYGGAVNIASRISALSAPGEVLVSDIVRGLARTSAGVTFVDRGEHALKGIGEPVRVFAVKSQR